MGILGLSVLSLAIEVWLVMDCVSSLVVESVSVSSGPELVDFCDSPVYSLDWLHSLDTVGAGEFGLDSGEVTAFGAFLISVWLLIEMSCASMFRNSSREYDGLEITGLLFMVVDGLGMVGLLCALLDGLARLVLHLFWGAGLLR